MNIETLLLEDVTIASKNDMLNDIYRIKLKEVFSPFFYSKVDRIIKKRILIDSFSDKTTVVAYTKQGHIFVNSKLFYSKKPDDAVIYLIHETLHLLEDLKYFPEIKQLRIKLWKIIQKNLTKPLSVFYTGKKQDLYSNGMEETLTYFIANRSCDFSALKPEGRKEYIEAIKNSELFNIHSVWMRKVLKQAELN
jgi:hypothetical protein